MFDGNYPVLMAEYARWMNSKLYAACEGLSDEERRADRGAFFKSIHATLEHLIWGDRIWLSRFDGVSRPATTLGAPIFDDFVAMRGAREALDLEMLTWAKSTDAAWLGEPMTLTSKIYGFTIVHPRWVYVTQMMNHGTHHRGQIATLLTQLGIDLGPTDIPVLPLLHEP
jgi:uncharacterized damage-inducible protein DinB